MKFYRVELTGKTAHKKLYLLPADCLLCYMLHLRFGVQSVNIVFQNENPHMAHT